MEPDLHVLLAEHGVSKRRHSDFVASEAEVLTDEVAEQIAERWPADSQVSELVGQHRSVEAQLEAIRAGADSWQDTAAAIVADLDAHVLEEEVDLFPYAVYLLDEVQWGAVADVHEQVRGEPDDARGHRLAVWA